MSNYETNKLYKESQCSIINLIQNNQDIEKKLVVNLLVLIKRDVTSNSTSANKNAALEMLEFLCQQKSEVILLELLDLLANSEPESVLHKCLLGVLEKRFVIDLNEDRNIVDILKPWMRLQNKLPAVLDTLFHTLSEEDSKMLLINKVIPTMMSLNVHVDSRDVLIEVAFILSPVVLISTLVPEELESFLQNIFTTYIPTISSLRHADYPNWHRMWIFLVRFCDKQIHYSMDLTNKLLRVVEFAFRSASYVQRLKGYDCWKELIANASLDMNYMSGPKHIKLLVTPLKAKFSKQEVVICKRFEVFCFLLEKLESKAVLCLPEFLDFCFGPIGDGKNASRSGQGRSVPQLWSKSAKVLIEIIGHGHDDQQECVSGKDYIKLEEPVMTRHNFHVYHKIVINSVGECCALLKETELGTEKEKVVACMWSRLFQLGGQLPREYLDNCYKSMLEVLDNYSKESKENTYFQELLVIILNVLSSIDKDDATLAFKHLFKLLSGVLFDADDVTVGVVTSLKRIYSHILGEMVKPNEKLELLKELLEHMAQAKGNEKNAQLFVLLIDEFVDVEVCVEVVEFDYFDDFFMWPTRNFHLLDDNHRKDVFGSWVRLYRKLIEVSKESKFRVLKNLEKIFKNNPLLASNVVAILNLISQCESEFSREFVVGIMKVVLLILELPNLTTDCQQKLSGIIMQYCDGSLGCFKSTDYEIVVKSICTCLERILSIHGYFRILDNFSIFLQDYSAPLRLQFGKYLSEPLEYIYQDQSNINGPLGKSIHKALQLFKVGDQIQPEKKVFVPPNGRAARIANLAKNSPQSPMVKSQLVTQPSLVRLFGKDLETMSPLKVKGSQLNNTTPRRSKKLAAMAQAKPSTPSINDESSSQFVVIDTEINFQPEKLNEHQKEVLKKRREDIPALYQDLSQSQSQDIFSSKGDSRDNKENLNAENNEVKVKLDFEQEDMVESVADHKVVEPVEASDDITDVVKDEGKLAETIVSGAVQFYSNHPVSEDLFSEIVDLKEQQQGIITEDTSTKTIGDFKDKVEMNIVDDTPQDDNKSEEEELQGSPGEAAASVDGEKDNSSPEKVRKKRNRKKNFDLELSRIQMDIVGAKEYFSKRSRRSLRKKEPPKEEEPRRRRKSTGADTKDAKANTKDVKANTKDAKANKNRRKTIGAMQEQIVPSTGTSADNKKASPEAPSKANKKQDRKRQTDVSPKDADIAGTKSSRLKKSPTNPKDHLDNYAAPILFRRSSFKIRLRESAKTARKGTKRKVDVEEETEDVIESSQESLGNFTTLLNSSRKRRKISSEALETTEDSTLVQQKTVTTSDFYKTNNENAGCEPAHISPQIEVETLHSPQMTPATFDKMISTTTTTVHAPPEANVTQDSTITQDSTQTHVDTTQDSLPDEEVGKANSSTQDTLTQTQETPTQSELYVVSEDRPTVLYFDLPKKPTLTESEQMMCRMDTMSICGAGGHQSVDEVEIRVATPTPEDDDKLSMDDILATPSTNSIPSSPVTVDTPVRTSDLLNNTIDISPITSKSSISDRESVDSTEIPVTMNIEYRLLEEFGTMDNVELEKHDDDDDEEIDDHKYENVPPPENVPDVEVEDEVEHVEDIPETVDDAVVELDDVPVVVEVIGTEVVVKTVEEVATTVDVVPAAVEVTPTVLDVACNDLKSLPDWDDHFERGQGTKGFTTIQERSMKLLNIVNLTSPGSKRLSSRRRGTNSSTMSPSTGRIKRLMSNCNQKQTTDSTEDLNKDDILTFTREVPSPLAVPRTSILKRKLSDSPDVDGVSPCAKRKRVNFSDPCLTSKKVFIKEDYEPSLEAKRLFDSTSDVRSKEDNLRDIFELVDEPIPCEKHTETETPETEPPMEPINPMILRKDRPIYPKLVDCKDDVMVVLKRVTSPMFVTTLTNKLKQKHIKTIGDLAKLSESEVNRFPFKVPVVANVSKALDNYYKKNVGKDELEAGQQVMKVNGFHEEEVVDKPLKVTRIEDKNLQDLKNLLLPLNRDTVIRLLTDHFQITEKDFLQGKDIKPTVTHVLDTLGVLKTVQMLFKIHETSAERGSFISAILDEIKSVSLSDILRRRNIEELHLGIANVVDTKVFSRRDVVDKCLIPLLQDQKDIGSYLSKLSVVDDFLSKNVEPRPEVADDVVSYFKGRIEAQPGDQQVEIMVDMFKFISARLDAATLVGLHLEFLSKMPDILRDRKC